MSTESSARTGTRPLSARLSHAAFSAFIVLVCLFIVAPMVIVVVQSTTAAGFVSFPPSGFSLKWYREVLQDPGYVSAFLTSLRIALLTSALSTVLGTAAAYAIARFTFPGQALLSVFFVAPLMVPRVVVGIALLVFLSALPVYSSVGGIVIGHTIITVPLVVRLVGAALSGVDPNLERAAQSLGATPLQSFLRITLPLIRRGILAGACLAAVVSFDDVPVAVFLVGPSSTTLPVRIYSDLQSNYTPVVPAVASLSILLLLLVGVLLERLFGLRRLFGNARI